MNWGTEQTNTTCCSCSSKAHTSVIKLIVITCIIKSCPSLFVLSLLFSSLSFSSLLFSSLWFSSWLCSSLLCSSLCGACKVVGYPRQRGLRCPGQGRGAEVHVHQPKGAAVPIRPLCSQHNTHEQCMMYASCMYVCMCTWIICRWCMDDDVTRNDVGLLVLWLEWHAHLFQHAFIL